MASERSLLESRDENDSTRVCPIVSPDSSQISVAAARSLPDGPDGRRRLRRDSIAARSKRRTAMRHRTRTAASSSARTAAWHAASDLRGGIGRRHERRRVRPAHRRRGQLRRARAPPRGHVQATTIKSARRRDARALPAVLPLLRQRRRRRSPSATSTRRARTTSSRCGPARACTAATTSTSSTGGRSTTRTPSAAASALRISEKTDDDDDPAAPRRHAAPRQPVPVPADPRSSRRSASATVDVTKLDRPRIVETLKLTQLIRNGRDVETEAASRSSLYGELHQLAAGVVPGPADEPVDRGLPSDTRLARSARSSRYWTGERDTYAQLVRAPRARHRRVRSARGADRRSRIDRTTSGAQRDARSRSAATARQELVRSCSAARTAASSATARPPHDLDAEVRRRHDRRPPAASSSASTSASRVEGELPAAPHRDPRSGHGRRRSTASRRRRLRRHAVLLARRAAASYKRPQIRLIYAVELPRRGRARALPASTTSSRSATSSTSSASAPSGGSTRARIREAIP